MIDGISFKGKRKVSPFLLQKQILQQLHNNYMDIQEWRLIAHEAVHRININTGIEDIVK